MSNKISVEKMADKTQQVNEYYEALANKVYERETEHGCQDGMNARMSETATVSYMDETGDIEVMKVDMRKLFLYCSDFQILMPKTELEVEFTLLEMWRTAKYLPDDSSAKAFYMQYIRKMGHTLCDWREYIWDTDVETNEETTNGEENETVSIQIFKDVFELQKVLGAMERSEKKFRVIDWTRCGIDETVAELAVKCKG